MRTSEERIEELHRRTAFLRQAKLRRKYRLLGGLAVCICLVLSVLFAAVVAHAPASTIGTISTGATASIFTDHGALGFVMVAVVAFCLGALVTILCYHMKKRVADGDKQDAGRH